MGLGANVNDRASKRHGKERDVLGMQEWEGGGTRSARWQGGGAHSWGLM